MVRECAVPECGTHARFNHPGESHGVFCSKHKVDGMRNVVHKPCAEPGCVTLAVFNQPGAGHGLYCGQHKPMGYVNVKDRKCQGAGCTRMPNFNFPGEKGGIFCAQHKTEGMIDIKHKRCVEPGCSKRPSFNFTGEMRALYCGPHKQDGMVNVDQERRSCNRTRFTGEGGSESKKQRTLGPGYSAKNAGFPLRQVPVPGTDQQGLPLDPQQMQGQAYALGVDPQSAMALAANFGAGVSGADGTVHLDPQSANLGSGTEAEGQAASYGQGHDPNEAPNASMQGQAQGAMQYFSHEGMQGHPGHDQSAMGQSQPLGFLLLPQTQWRGEGQPVGPAQQASQQQQLMAEASKQPQAYMSPAAGELRLPSPAEVKHHSSQLHAEQLQGKPLSLLPHSCHTPATCSGADESTRRAMEQRSLGHAMHTHLVEFLRSFLHAPNLQESKEARTKVRDYIDRFTSWDPDTRVEQYSLLQFDWELAPAKDKWAAVEERISKALGLV